MSQSIKAAFERDGIVLKLDQLLPTRQVTEKLKRSYAYKKVLASIPIVGIIEPPRVYKHSGNKYLLLNGHLRVEALRELGITETLCLVATTAENCTDNRHVCQIPPIQQGRMIERAIQAGVSAEDIAAALDLKASTIQRQRNLLREICPEAVDLLKDKPVSKDTISLLGKVKPMRQVEMAELMIAAGTYSASYARGLFLTTAKDQLVEPDKPKRLAGVKPEDRARLEQELLVVEKSYRLLDATHNDNVVTLTIARGYIRQLLGNSRVVRFLSHKHREVLAEFRTIVESAAEA